MFSRTFLSVVALLLCLSPIVAEEPDTDSVEQSIEKDLAEFEITRMQLHYERLQHESRMHKIEAEMLKLEAERIGLEITARKKIRRVESDLEKQSRLFEAAVERLARNGKPDLANEIRERLEELHAEMREEQERERHERERHEREHSHHDHAEGEHGRDDWEHASAREKEEVYIELKEKLEWIATEAEKAKRNGNRAEVMELREMYKVVYAEITEIQGKDPSKDRKAAKANAKVWGNEMLRDMTRRLAQAEKDGDKRMVKAIKRRIGRMSLADLAYEQRPRKRTKDRHATESKDAPHDDGTGENGKDDAAKREEHGEHVSNDERKGDA